MNNLVYKIQNKIKKISRIPKLKSIAEYEINLNSRWNKKTGPNPFVLQKIETFKDQIQENLISFKKFEEQFKKISYANPHSELQPYWDNDWIPPIDAISLCSFISSLNSVE